MMIWFISLLHVKHSDGLKNYINRDSTRDSA